MFNPYKKDADFFTILIELTCFRNVCLIYLDETAMGGRDLHFETFFAMITNGADKTMRKFIWESESGGGGVPDSYEFGFVAR